MTHTKKLRDNDLADRATVQGLWASSCSWALEQDDTPWAVCKAASAHGLGESTQRALNRGDAHTTRRRVVDQWAEFLQRS